MKRLLTIKSKIIVMAIVFAIFISVAGSIYNYSFLRNSSLNTKINSSYFQLQMVSSSLDQRGNAIKGLMKWANTNGDVNEYLYSDEKDSSISFQAYNSIIEQLSLNTSYIYINRFIIAKKDRSGFLHFSSNASNLGQPISKYNLDKIIPEVLDEENQWYPLVNDPYFIHKTKQLMVPIYNTIGKKGEIFISVSPNILFDKMKNYEMEENNHLFLNMGNYRYEIIDNHSLIPTKMNFSSKVYKDNLSNKEYQQILIDGKMFILVTSYTQFEGISISQAIPVTWLPTWSYYSSYFIILLVFIFGIALILALALNRKITNPVIRIENKINEIANEKFEVDPSIEGDDELGKIGKSVNDLSVRIDDLLKSKVQNEKDRQDLEYSMLLSRINPHFLYNTLGSIKWMATIQKSPGIAEMATSLSRLMKNIAKAKQTLISVEDEISLLDDYMVIEKYRYGGTITIKKDIDESLLSYSIPRFTLQPLVENAIFHGIEPKQEPGVIDIIVKKVDEEVFEIIIKDDGMGMDESELNLMKKGCKKEGEMFNSFGVKSVDERIRHIFGKEYGLTIDSKKGCGTKATIRLPQMKEVFNEL